MLDPGKKRDGIGSGPEALLHSTKGMPVRRFQWLQMAALGIVLLTIATRLPALRHPQAIDDEAPYSVVANEIVDGGRPYIDSVDRKPPLLFWTYAAVFAIAGKYNWMALHGVAVVWTADSCQLRGEFFGPD